MTVRLDDRRMDLVRLGRVLRAVRIRQGLRQSDVAGRARISRATISRVERGHAGTLSLDTLEAIAQVLEVRLDLKPSWRGGELDRLTTDAHARLQALLIGRLTERDGWIAVPEVSFAVAGERGIIDIVGWYASARALLVIEVKTQLIDVPGLLGSVDRKRRLGPAAVAVRGWRPASVGLWVVMADTRTNRRHVERHSALLRSALPDGIVHVRSWLGAPDRPLAALTFLSYDHPGNAWQRRAGASRVRAPTSPPRSTRREAR